MTITSILANHCEDFYNAMQGLPEYNRASTREDFKSLLQRGYRGVSHARPQQTRQFLNAVGGAQWGELNDAGASFARETGVGQLGHWGARDFMGVLWKMTELDRRVGGNGIRGVTFRPTVASGFNHLNTNQQNALVRQAQHWHDLAAQVTRNQQFNDLGSWRDYYRNQAGAAKNLYIAAVRRHENLPRPIHNIYLSHLHNHPSEIWQAYKISLRPHQQQMARRLSLIILSGYDPYSDSPPPSSAAASWYNTLRDIF